MFSTAKLVLLGKLINHQKEACRSEDERERHQNLQFKRAAKHIVHRSTVSNPVLGCNRPQVANRGRLLAQVPLHNTVLIRETATEHFPFRVCGVVQVDSNQFLVCQWSGRWVHKPKEKLAGTPEMPNQNQHPNSRARQE
jgi:hypothetical protein